MGNEKEEVYGRTGGERERGEIKDPRGRLTNSREKKEGVKSTLNEVRPFGRKQWWSLVTDVYCMVRIAVEFVPNRGRRNGNTITIRTDTSVGSRMLPSAGREELDEPRKGQVLRWKGVGSRKTVDIRGH